MNISIIAWSGLILALCATTFGLWWCITITVCIIIFLIGGMTPLYLLHWEAAQKYYTDLYRRKVQDVCPGLSKVTSMLDLDNDCLRKLDKRLTGAQAVDETLQEVLNLLLRDYLESWYNKVSSNPEFPYEVRKTIQKLAVNFSGRMKEVDWIPFLTTRLVDDAASHLRLFRQARAKLKQTHPTVASNSINQPESAATSSSGQEYVAKGSNIQSSSSTGNTSDLEGTFFDLEVTMEGSLLCRDLVCTDAEYEKQYLRDVAEVVLYLLLPAEDFQCKSLRFLLRELLVSSVILPVFTLFTDPDYINQIIIWLLCKEIPLTSEVFLTALRVTDNKDELYATRDLVTKEICQLRSRDSGGDDDTIVKQQLSSLLYLRKVVDSRLQRLKEGTDSDSAGLPSQLDWSRLTGTGIQSNRLFQLPLDVILKNNIALSYFIDYMTNIGAQAYLFFYLNVEGWRVSAEQQISDFELQKLGVTSAGVSEKKVHYGSNAVDSMREAAYSIFEQYLSEKASPRLRLDDSIVRKLLLRIRSETPYSETWFDEVQAAVYEKLQTEERFLPSFRSSVGYVRLLAELDLLKESCGNVGNSALLGTGEEEEDSAESSLSDNASLASFESDSAVAGVLADVQSIDVALPSIDTFSSDVIQDSSTLDEKRQGPSALLAEIIETGIVNDRGKTYGIYAVSVGRKYENTGHVDKWHVYRRYSDFHDLHSKIKEKYSDLAKLTFPGKKTFHNMERAVLEKRMKMLNDYLQILIQPGVISTHPLLKDYLASFLDQRDFGSTSGSSSSSGIGIGISGANIMTQTLDSLVVNPLRSSMRTVGQAVRTMPDNLLSTVDGVVDGLSKVFSGNQSSAQRPPGFYESMKVGASLHIETDDNIPLRIMLLLMDEVFDLKSRNQWLRRRIVTLLRQIIRTMFGDIVNRRILDYVSLMTSPEQVADYLRTFKHSLWPNGVRAEPKPPRDDATRMRTRVAAKVALLSSLSDELKHIIGSETARRGLLRVFELFQRPVLNRRLLHVLLEGVLQTLFPQHRLNHIFKTLHSRSGRVPNRGTDMVLRGEALGRCR